MKNFHLHQCWNKLQLTKDLKVVECFVFINKAITNGTTPYVQSQLKTFEALLKSASTVAKTKWRKINFDEKEHVYCIIKTRGLGYCVFELQMILPKEKLS